MREERLYIQEVSVRDGFQIEPRFIPTEDKIHLINALSRTGLSKIEVTSFTSPRAIPALADAEVVMKEIDRLPDVVYAALVPNVRGCERALDCGVDEINVFMSASSSHNQANLRMTPEQSLAQFRAIAAEVSGRAWLNASLSTAFGCPFEGDVPEALVLQRVAEFVDMGMQGVSLCDTTGMANPMQVTRLCEAVQARWPELTVTVHFHDTRGMGLANALAAWQTGIRHFDASLGGLGGCPFAPGASGNVCTEDLVHMFQSMGCETGVDLPSLLAAAATLPPLVGHDLPGQVLKAGPSTRRFPLPA